MSIVWSGSGSNRRRPNYEYFGKEPGKPHESLSTPEAIKIYLGNSRQISPENRAKARNLTDQTITIYVRIWTTEVELKLERGYEGLSVVPFRLWLMDITYGELKLGVDGDQGKVPFWFFGLTEFAYGICSTRDPLSTNCEHYVISLPDIDGGLAAVALGALAAEIDRIERNSNFEEISLTQLEVGMKVSIDSGISGQQKITGQVKTLALEDRTPRIEIGSRWIAAKFIQKICLLPSEAGNPQIFQRKTIENGLERNFLEHLSSAAIPIHRAILDIRSTTKIIEDELNWEFSFAGESKTLKVKDSVKPMSSGQPGSGWTLVLNSSESEDLAWENLGSYLNGSELDADISVLCSGSAILAQLEGVNSRVTFSILGRDDRQLAATELAIKQKYEYSNPLSRNIDSTRLGRGIELVAFEVPLNV